MTLIERALAFATNAHHGQARKYTNEPYINHPISVANILLRKASVRPSAEMIAAAYLHDVCEDCNVPLSEIDTRFGNIVTEIVYRLTDPETFDWMLRKQNRATRKAAAREHIGGGSNDAKTIKLADLIHNTESIEKHDPKFWKVYRQEKLLLMPHLIGGDEQLFNIAAVQCGY